MGLAASVPLTKEDNFSITYYAPQPRAVLRVVDPNNTEKTVDYGHLGPRRTHDDDAGILHAALLERDEALRRNRAPPTHGDGVAEVRPFGAMEKTIVEGVTEKSVSACPAPTPLCSFSACRRFRRRIVARLRCAATTTPSELHQSRIRVSGRRGSSNRGYSSVGRASRSHEKARGSNPLTSTTFRRKHQGGLHRESWKAASKMGTSGGSKSGPALAGAFEGLLAAPAFDVGVVAAEQNIGDFPAEMVGSYPWTHSMANFSGWHGPHLHVFEKLGCLRFSSRFVSLPFVQIGVGVPSAWRMRRLSR